MGKSIIMTMLCAFVFSTAAVAAEEFDYDHEANLWEQILSGEELENEELFSTAGKNVKCAQGQLGGMWSAVARCKNTCARFCPVIRLRYAGVGTQVRGRYWLVYCKCR